MASPIDNPTSEGRRARPQRGQTVELKVDSIAHGGAGVARLDGYVVFVEEAFPGETVLAEITKSKRDYGNARMVELIDPSADRVEQRCDHEGEPCPGSPWQQLRYDVQVERKQELVSDALRRIGRLDGFELEPIVSADPVWRYRNKMEYSFGPSAGKPADGSGAGRPGLALGFHPRGRWDVIRNARDCWLASERSNAVRNAVRDWAAAQGLTAYDRRSGDGFLRNLVVREGTATGALQARLVSGDGAFDSDGFVEAVRRFDPAAGVLWTRTAAIGETTRDGETLVLAGDDRLDEELGGLRFRISPEAFFQTNTTMAERLYEIAATYAQLTGHERIYDLYCGIGTLSLVLSLRGGELWAVDIVEPAIADAIANAALNEIDNVHFFAGDVRSALRPLLAEAPRPDVVVVDPPRAGLSKKVIRRLIETAAKRIVYVSCNQTTLAANARQIVDGGYRIVKVRAVDMFPHTPHVECVALFERSADG